MSTTPSKPKRLQLYKSYAFKSGDKDPVIDKIHTMLEDAGLSYYKAAEASGVAAHTISEWIEGDTKRPKYCTIMAVAGACGFEQKWVKKKGARDVADNVNRRSRLAAVAAA